MNPPAPSRVRPSRRSFLKIAATASLSAASWRAVDVFVPHSGSRAPLSPPNEKIQQARDAALAVLKPTARELERGLVLHAESLVCEPYGFAPRCAVDGAAFEAAVAAGASDRELQDLREEMMMTRCVTDARERKEFLEAFRAAGMTCVFQNAGEEGNDPLRLIKRLARYTFVADMLRPELVKAVQPDDIAAAKRNGNLCLYMAANGVPLAQRWDNARDELGFIRAFFQAGVRSMHLTYNRRNPLGDGAGEASDGGLSDFGRLAVEEMNRVGVIVDVAHSGWRTAAEAAKASRKPVMASHTACAGLYHHIRAKPDEVLKAVCDTGGLFGICAISRFLGGVGDIRVMLDHLDYAIKKFGSEHVAIATDVAYVSRFEEEERKKVTRRGGVSPLALPASRWEQLWPPGEFASVPAPQAVLTTAWTNWPLFTVGLVQRGHSDAAIRQVIGENALRVARANFPVAPTQRL
jgi:membrane dipeptidase